MGKEFAGFSGDQLAPIVGDQLGNLMWDVLQVGDTFALHADSSNPGGDNLGATKGACQERVNKVMEASN